MVLSGACCSIAPQCPHHINATRGKTMHAIHTTHTTKKQMQQLSYEYDEVCPSFTSTQFGFGYPTPHTLMTINLFTSRYASEGSFGRAFPHYLVAASLDKEKFRCKVASSVGCKWYPSREEHGEEFLKVTAALADRLANAGREQNAEEVLVKYLLVYSLLNINRRSAEQNA